MEDILDKDKIIEIEIEKLKRKNEIKKSKEDSNDEIKKIEKEIEGLERLKGRIEELKKLHGISKEGYISDINDSGAIPLGPIEGNAKVYNNDDVSPIVNPNLSEEERKIEFLCQGRQKDEKIGYDVEKIKTKFKIHYLKARDGGVRPGKKLSGNKRIVIHETRTELGYAPSDRTSDYYEKSMDSNDVNGKEVGYHFLCDKDQIICFIPWDEVAFHASSRFFNYKSIGIERIVTEDAGIEALYNQAKLVATLMYLNNIPINRVITHLDATYARRFPIKDSLGNVKRDESGEIMYNIKSCPDRLINGEYGGLSTFKQVIINCLRNKDLFLKELEEIQKEYTQMDEINTSKSKHSR